MSALKESVIASLRKVHDPEIPVNIYDLGLIYDLAVSDGGAVAITMTLTAPNCPVADQIVEDVRKAAVGTEGVTSAEVSLVFEPAWTDGPVRRELRLELLAMGVDPDRAKESLVNRPTGLTIGRKPSG